MQVTGQKSFLRTKFKFMFCIAIMLSLFYISMINKHQVSNYEYVLFALSAISALVFNYFSLNKLFRLFEQEKASFSRVDYSIKSALRKILKWSLLFKALKVELLTLYYAFFAKFESHETTNEITSFSYSKLSDAKDLFLVVALAQLPTLPFIHVFIENKEGPELAWCITLLTLWSVIWYLAQVQAIRFRPIELDSAVLRYRFGLFWKADIPLKQIRKARKTNYKDKMDGFSYFMSPLGSEKILSLSLKIQFDLSVPIL